MTVERRMIVEKDIKQLLLELRTGKAGPRIDFFVLN